MASPSIRDGGMKRGPGASMLLIRNQCEPTKVIVSLELV